MKIDDEWQAIVGKRNRAVPEGASEEQKRQALETFVKDAEAIAQRIQAVKIDPNDLPNEVKEEIQTKDLLNKQNRLMVRSTGREDTKELANAGGNESIANVKPDPEAIVDAIKQVAISYFSPKSIKQRADAEDRTLFSKNAPLTPVLVQKMIGEEVGNQEADGTTRCGVMFTEETEGAVKKDGDESKTSGVTVIQAAYGHNAAVVNSLIPADTHYVDNKGHITTVVREKPRRYIPDNDGNLIWTDNPETLKQQAALSTEAVKALKQLAQDLEAHYGCPMDVEYVIDEKTKTINIVQARPIVHNASKEPASYLDLDKIDGDHIACESIISGGGSLQLITDPKQVIVVDNIGQALAAYQKTGFDTKAVKAVIIKEPALKTSHEATVFRGKGIPVLKVDDIKGIEEQLEQKSIIIDLQQNVIVTPQEKIDSIADLKRSGMAKTGWTNYPVPLQITIPHVEAPNKDLVGVLTPKVIQKEFDLKPDDFDAITRQIKTDTNEMNKLYAQLRATDPSDQVAIRAIHAEINKSPTAVANLVKQLKTANAADTNTILATIATKMNDNLRGYQDLLTLNPDLRATLTDLNHHFFQAVDQLRQCADIKEGAPDYTKKLFAIRMLEAVVYQAPARGEIKEGQSYGRLLKDLKDMRKSVRSMVEEEKYPAAAAAVRKQKTATLSIKPNSKPEPKLSRFKKAITEVIKKNRIQRMAKIIKEDQELKTRAQHLQEKNRTALFNQLGQQAMTPELGERWATFVKELPVQNHQRLATLVKDLSNYDVLELWLHTSFANAKGANAQEKLAALEAEMKAARPQLQHVDGLKKAIAPMEQTTWLDAWEDPGKETEAPKKAASSEDKEAEENAPAGKTHKAFDDRMKELKKIVTQFEGNDFRQKFDTTTDLGRMVTLQAMNKLVEQFDLAIKRQSRSEKGEYGANTNLKVDHFKQMLNEYGKLVLEWTEINGAISRLSTNKTANLTATEKYQNDL
ncbi:MAG: PEP/pyruvate-binding domain-containing protein, partial [Candidatus Babeliales bacterium]